MNESQLKNLKLLYVEDEVKVRKYAISYFKRFFDHVYEANNAISALEIFKKEKPHILVTDIKMDEVSGLELIQEIRKIDKSCQIIILTAFLDTKYLLEAVELNLVKYLTKPIEHEEIFPVLMQCTKNVSESNHKFHFAKNCYYHPFKEQLIKNEEIIKLTNRELLLLKLLCKNEARTVSYEEIENHIWYDSAMSENALRILVRKLRAKLPNGTLQNISKLGYMIQCL